MMARPMALEKEMGVVAIDDVGAKGGGGGGKGGRGGGHGSGGGRPRGWRRGDVCDGRAEGPALATPSPDVVGTRQKGDLRDRISAGHHRGVA